ncbi:MAG: ketopantoate reductase family protein [Solirubrobacteraceae bacterium]
MDEERRDIIVVGAGAIGRILGAGLAAGGEPAVLLDVDEALVAQINARGVRVERDGSERQVRVDAITSVNGRRPAELVLFCVKSYVTASAAEHVRQIVDDETTVVSLQNGWGNGDVLADCCGAERVVVGVTYNSATVTDGKVVHSGAGATLVGPYEGEDLSRAQRVADTLRAGGFEAQAAPRVREEIWKKLVLNAATLPTAALTGLAAGQLASHEEMLPLVDQVTREAVAVARGLGYGIDADERIAVIHEALERVGDGKASMLQDLETDRRTEIDVITGAVLRAAGEAGVDAPLHRALYALVRGAERAKGLS